MQRTIERARLRLAAARTMDGAARWGFYAALAAFAALTAGLFLSIELPWRFAAFAVALAALAGAIRARRPSLRDAARALDTALGLDERLLTAMEFEHDAGPMAAAMRRDAARALASADLSRALRRTWPLEVKLLPAVLALTAAVALASVRSSAPPPAVAIDGPRADALRWIEPTKEPDAADVAKLRAALQKAAEALASGKDDPHLAIELASIAEGAADRVKHSNDLSSSDIEILKSIARSAGGAAAALGRGGVVRGDEAVARADRLLDRAFEGTAETVRHASESGNAEAPVLESSPAGDIMAAGTTHDAGRPWPAHHDALVRRYFEFEKR